MLSILGSPRSSEPRTTFTGWPTTRSTAAWNAPKRASSCRSTANRFTMPARRSSYSAKNALDGIQSCWLSVDFEIPTTCSRARKSTSPSGMIPGGNAARAVGEIDWADGHRRADLQPGGAREALVDDDLVGLGGIWRPAVDDNAGHERRPRPWLVGKQRRLDVRRPEHLEREGHHERIGGANLRKRGDGVALRRIERRLVREHRGVEHSGGHQERGERVFGAARARDRRGRDAEA